MISESQVQVKAKPEADELHLCFVEVNKRIWDIKSSQMMGTFIDFDFADFYKYFGRLVSISSHEECMRDIIYNGSNLIHVCKRYLSDPNRARRNVNLGLRLGEIYLSALQRNGVCHYHD